MEDAAAVPEPGALAVGSREEEHLAAGAAHRGGAEGAVCEGRWPRRAGH